MSLYTNKQHVDTQTHKQGNTLDWIMSKENSTTISGINEGDYLSDHCAITWTHKVEKQPMEKIIHTSGDLKSIKNKILPQIWQIGSQHLIIQMTFKLCMKNTQKQ